MKRSQLLVTVVFAFGNGGGVCGSHADAAALISSRFQLLTNLAGNQSCIMVRKLLVIGVLAVVFVGRAQSSAIPMWEYLSRGEKMSHLFNMFVQQVEKHCSEQQESEPDCNKLLLVYGLTKLANMEDHSLDDMDPYQRDANKIVWDSMMSGSHAHSTTPRNLNRNEADDMAVGDEQGAASSVHETQSRPQSFLLGPMVVRVLPNGMPIPGEKNDLPKDEDVEEFAPSSLKMAQIAKELSTTPKPWFFTTPRRISTARVRSPIYPVYP